ncbi:MAG: preprotein translocase subunit SecG [Cellvibrio sp.]|uniref:preprotein translocase subunit SecG n=1 Tax=Cellvibrio sp. TaxID=1965322 RepID=UPI0027159039|nr:preprotein translocase subunit SecG [Cellvibrio sp.]
MSVFLKIVLVVQMLSALGMIGLILIQHGKGADMGAAFGSGGSGSLFGASGSANFMSRATSVLAGVFFVATLMLSYFGNLRTTATSSVLEGAAVTAPAPAPVPAGPAGQIPGNSPAATAAVPAQAPVPTVTPSAATSTVPTAPVAGSKGTVQIPTK